MNVIVECFLDISRFVVFKYVKVFMDIGFIVVYKDGRECFCYVSFELLKEVLEWVS